MSPNAPMKADQILKAMLGELMFKGAVLEAKIAEQAAIIESQAAEIAKLKERPE